MRSQLVGMSLGCSIVLGALGSFGCGRMGFSDEEAVLPGEPTEMKLSYPAPGTFHALLDEPMPKLEPIAEQLDSFSVSPPLPLGLTLDEATGIISGMPVEASDRRRYVITGKGAQGELNVAIHLTALAGWKVTTTVDGVDDNLPDGICLSTPAGGCSLRAAIQNANLANRPRMVLLPQGTYSITSEIKPITTDLVLAGVGIGQTVLKSDALPRNFRFMSYTGGRAVRIEAASFQRFGLDDGGVLQVNESRLEVFDAEFSQNSSNSTGGVMCIDGGSEAYLENVSFFNNEALVGDSHGGVINVSNPGTKVTVVKSTAIGNQAEMGSFAWVDLGGSLEIINSTITGNFASEAAALAAYEGSIVVRNSTISGNTTSGVTAGLGIGMGSSSITLANTIVAFNLSVAGEPRNCETEAANATLISLGGNLFNNDGDGCKELMAGRPGELNADLKLDDEAKDNGGRTKTIAIKSGSAAVGRGVSQHCPEEDQRGVKRKTSEGSACDAGAYELEQ